MRIREQGRRSAKPCNRRNIDDGATSDCLHRLNYRLHSEIHAKLVDAVEEIKGVDVGIDEFDGFRDCCVVDKQFTEPNAESAVSMTVFHPDSDDTSWGTNTADLPMSSAMAVPSSARTSVSTTFAPRSANMRASCSPIAPAAPVTMAVSPETRSCVLLGFMLNIFSRSGCRLEGSLHRRSQGSLRR